MKEMESVIYEYNQFKRPLSQEAKL